MKSLRPSAEATPSLLSRNKRTRGQDFYQETQSSSRRKWERSRHANRRVIASPFSIALSFSLGLYVTTYLSDPSRRASRLHSRHFNTCPVLVPRNQRREVNFLSSFVALFILRGENFTSIRDTVRVCVRPIIHIVFSGPQEKRIFEPFLQMIAQPKEEGLDREKSGFRIARGGHIRIFWAESRTANR